MDTQSFLPNIFIEHVGSASIIPFVSNLTLEAMRYFGGFDMSSAMLVAIAGLVAGCLLNWLIGLGLSIAYERMAGEAKMDFSRGVILARRYGFVFAALFWAPLGGIILLLLGFFRAPLWKTTIMCLVGALYSTLHL